MTTMRRLFAFAVMLAGCANSGALDGTGFRAPNSVYTVAYADPKQRQFMSADWNLDNFYEGRMKTDGAYRSEVAWVWADGSISSASFVTHDLKLTHRSSSAVIWVRTLPVPPNDAVKTLNAVAEDWVDGLNGTVLDFSFSRAIGARRIATKVLESKPDQISGHRAHRIEFELANLDQLELDPQAPRTRVRALFIQAPLEKIMDVSGSLAPACLFVAYANDARAFDEHAPDFEDFVRRIQIRND